MAEHSIALPLRLAHTLARKKSSYDKPPSDPAELDIEKPFLRRTSTLQSYVDGGPNLDNWNPARARYFHEPEQLLPDAATTVAQIEGLAEAHLARIPKPLDISRSTTGLETPSRTSSLESVGDLLAPNRRRVDLDHFSELGLPDPGPENGPRSDIVSCAPSTHSSPAATRHGSPRRSSVLPIQANTQLGIAEASSPYPLPFVEDNNAERASKRLKVEDDTHPDAKTEALRPLGCPMCKANRKRYERVIGPCTDLRGITPKPKALMEHLKKQHSSENRCMKCWKWHNSDTELAKHIAVKAGPHRCNECCREFKKKAEYDKHRLGPPCKLNQLTKPELFDEEQEKAFHTMKHKSSSKGTIEEKYMWCFDKLFPKYAERDTIWPWYDFALIAHNLPGQRTRDFLERYAGGLKQDPSSATSPSQPEHDVQTPTPTPGPEMDLSASHGDEGLSEGGHEQSTGTVQALWVGSSDLSLQSTQLREDEMTPSYISAAPSMAASMLMPPNMGQQLDMSSVYFSQPTEAGPPQIPNSNAPPFGSRMRRYPSLVTNASFNNSAPSMTRSTSHSTHAGAPHPPGTPAMLANISGIGHGMGVDFGYAAATKAAPPDFTNQPFTSFGIPGMMLPQMDDAESAFINDQLVQWPKESTLVPANPDMHSHHYQQQPYDSTQNAADPTAYHPWGQPPQSHPSS